MRIYILSNTIVKKNILAKLESYLHETRFISYIWSVNGLMQIENDKLYKIKIKDVMSRKTLLGAYPITIDESEFIREEECYQIVPRHYKEYSTLKSYRLKEPIAELIAEPNASALEWIMEYKDDELYDNYFTLPNGEDIHSPRIKADILQFLNL